MIYMDELKPILEGLVEGRDDAADVIEQVMGLDKDVEVDRSEIDALNASWNDRFKKAFFGERADDLKDEVPKVEEKEEEFVEERSEDYDGEDLTYDKLFTEVKEKEED